MFCPFGYCTSIHPPSSSVSPCVFFFIPLCCNRRLLINMSSYLMMTQNASCLVNTQTQDKRARPVLVVIRLSLKILCHNSINSFVYEHSRYKTPRWRENTDRDTAKRKRTFSLFCSSSFAQHFQAASPRRPKLPPNYNTGETEQRPRL